MRVPTIELWGTPFHAIDERQCVREILERHAAGKGGWVATHNLDHLRRLRNDREFAAICRTASLRMADGMPLIWASKMQGEALPERVAGSSLIYSLTGAAARLGCSVYFLGGNPGTAEKTAGILSTWHPQLRVAGTECPPVGFEADPDYLQSLAQRLNSAAPDIVYVALGSPKQEQLIAQLVDGLPKAWFLGVGVSFSFVAGEIRRAPVWMQRSSLEWLHRLMQEPIRLGKRYIVDGMRTAFLLFATCLVARYRSRRRIPAESGELSSESLRTPPSLTGAEELGEEGMQNSLAIESAIE